MSKVIHLSLLKSPAAAAAGTIELLLLIGSEEKFVEVGEFVGIDVSEELGDTYEFVSADEEDEETVVEPDCSCCCCLLTVLLAFMFMCQFNVLLRSRLSWRRFEQVALLFSGLILVEPTHYWTPVNSVSQPWINRS